MIRLLVAVSLALSLAASACIEVESRRIGTRTWQMWGEDLRDFRAMAYAVPPEGEARCRYWEARKAEADAPEERVASIGTWHRSEAFRAFVADERDKSCPSVGELDRRQSP